ncbi:MAG TPA: ATP-binding protein [Gemmatimonadaceae bacterium]|nr:ATP-binding protein [Gemmatimonadaceae bacterium]
MADATFASRQGLALLRLRRAQAETASQLQLRLRQLSRLCGPPVLLGSLVILAGWALGDNRLQTLFIGQVTVKPNTAAALGAGALALVLLANYHQVWARYTAIASSSLVLATGMLTLGEYIFGVDLGIDQILFNLTQDPGNAVAVSRMAAVSASEFVLLGAGLLGLTFRSLRADKLAQLLFLFTGAAALTALLAYIYGAIPTTGTGQGIQIAIPTAIMLLILSVGSLALRPHAGWMPIVLSRRAGGVLARRLLPFAFFVPLFLGALRVLGTWIGGYSVAAVAASVAVLTMICFGSVIAWTSRALNDADRLREAAEREQHDAENENRAARAKAIAEKSARGAAEAAREVAEQAAVKITEALSLLDLVLNSSPVGFALLDNEYRCLRINPAIARMFGIAAEADHEGKFLDFDIGDGESFSLLFDRVARSGEAIRNLQMSREAKGEAGKKCHWLISIYPVWGSDSDSIGLGLVIVDMTERKELEATLLQSQKVEAIGQLAGSVAHDFNNIITVIKSYSELALMDVEPGTPLHGDVSEIRAAADRAAGLTGQLLAFSRKQEVQLSALDPAAVIHGLENMLSRLIPKTIQLSVHAELNAAEVIADRGQLEQVLMNFVVNASDAMPSGGDLIIETRTVELHEGDCCRMLKAKPGSYVRISVSDTGEGMTPQTLEKAFEPFYTTKPCGKGTGLGLATIYSIVNQFGGDISVQTEVGVGTTFNVFLPLSEQESRREPGTLPRRATMLVVDDDTSVLQVVSRILRGHGYDVIQASGGDEALKIYNENPSAIHLVLTDIVMPGMTGLDLANAFEQLTPGVKILFMTGYGVERLTDRELEKGRTGLVLKPFTPTALLTQVGDILDVGEAA